MLKKVYLRSTMIYNRTGLYDNETMLNKTNVGHGSFGKLFVRTVDDQIYAQPSGKT